MRTGSGRSRRGRAAYVAITAVAFALLLTGLAEAFLRLRWIAPSERSASAFSTHPLYGSGPAPGARGMHVSSEYACSFENNLLGCRGPLPDLSPDGERARLLVLGDSQTYGLGVSNGETFSDGLRSALPEVELLNAGSNGYGTRESLAVLHHLGGAWRPDVALLVFFWNDLEDNVKHALPAFALDAQGAVVRTDPFPADFAPLALRPAVQAAPQGVSGLRLPKFLKEGLRGFRYRYFGIKRRSIRDGEQLEQAWSTAAALLALLQARADELGCRLVVAALPDHNQVDPRAVIRNIEPLNFEVQDASSRSARRWGSRPSTCCRRCARRSRPAATRCTTTRTSTSRRAGMRWWPRPWPRPWRSSSAVRRARHAEALPGRMHGPDGGGSGPCAPPCCETAAGAPRADCGSAERESA